MEKQNLNYQKIHSGINDHENINLLAFAKALWKRAFIIILCTLMGGALFVGYAELLVEPQYSSSIMVYINNTTSSSKDNMSITSQELAAAQSLVDTYMVILNTMDTLQTVAEESGLNYNYKQISNMISSSAVNETEIFKITVTCSSAEDAYQIAQTIADVLPDKISAIVDGSSVRIVENATLNLNKVSPSARKYAMIGCLLGFVLCCWIILIRFLMNNTIENNTYLLEAFNVPILASIPDLKSKSKKGYGYYGYGYRKSSGGKEKQVLDKNKKINPETAGGDELVRRNLSFYASEAYKRLRVNLSFCVAGEGECRVIGVTSSLSGEGKTTTAINLAYALAEDGKRVMLIDGDMRLSTIADRTGVPANPGLSNLLAENTKESVVYSSPLHTNLFVIPAGDTPPNPSELLGRDCMEKFLKIIKSKVDYIIIDLPPVSDVVDALVVDQYLEGMIIVVRRNYATKRSVSSMMRQMELTDANVLGFVMTYDESFDSQYGRYGRGRYGYKK